MTVVSETIPCPPTTPTTTDPLVVVYGCATCNNDLEQILELQKMNRPEVLSEQEQESQGFLSARHDVNLLGAMNHPYPHTIATTSGPKGSPSTIVGYALSLDRAFDANRIPHLDGLNQEINRAVYQGTPLSDLNYIIMGQVCVARQFRGQGVFVGLYDTMRQRLQGQFDGVVTAVSSRNPRSLRAHAKVGFVVVHQYEAHGHDWQIVLWDWRTVEAATPETDGAV